MDKSDFILFIIIVYLSGVIYDINIDFYKYQIKRERIILYNTFGILILYYCIHHLYIKGAFKSLLQMLPLDF